jgi:hypothetical protein
MTGRSASGRVLASLAIVIVLAACNSSASPTPLPPTPTPIPAPTQAPQPTSTPDLVLARATATLYQQDFESGTALGLFDQSGNWSVSADSTGNHVFCNALSGDWQSFKFGSDTWTNYGVEARVDFLAETPDQAAELYARVDPSMDGYRATLSQGSASLAYYPPPTSLGGSSIPTQANTWYTLRLEAAGSHLRFFVDDRPIADGLDSQRSIGTAGFGVGPNTKACVDDIRLWELTPDGQIVSTSPRAKYEGACDQCFVFDEGPPAPIGDPATAGYTYRPGDTREIVTLDEQFQVPAGKNVTFDNKIIIVQPVQRQDILVFGTLTVTNSLVIWRQTSNFQSRLRIEKGGTLAIKDSYAFSGDAHWLNWDYDDGSTVRFDHFVGNPWTTAHGSVDYSAINYSSVRLTILSNQYEIMHDTHVRVSNAHELWLELFPPEGTYAFTLPAKRQWADWRISDLWPNTTVDVHDSYVYERDISLSPNTHVTVQDTPTGFGLGWTMYKDDPPFVTCELRNVGQLGAGNEDPKYYEDMTWDLPCINSSMTVKNSALERMWPYIFGWVHLKVYNSDLADTGIDGAPATEEIYGSTISQIFDTKGGLIYVEDSQISDLLDVRDPDSVVYGYGVTGPYQLLQSGGGAYVPLDKPGPPW